MKRRWTKSCSFFVTYRVLLTKFLYYDIITLNCDYDRNSWQMEKKLLIFDLDGTIADTIFTIRDAVNMCMEHFGFPVLDTQTVRRNVGNGVRVLIEGCAPEEAVKDADRFEEVLSYFRECYKITHDQIDGCYNGLEAVIHELYARGYTLAVLSNKPDALVKSIIKKLFDDGIYHLYNGEFIKEVL